MRTTTAALALALALAGCDDTIGPDEIAGSYFGPLTVTVADPATGEGDSQTFTEAFTVRATPDGISIPAVGCEVECRLTSRGAYSSLGEIDDLCVGATTDGASTLWRLSGTCLYDADTERLTFSAYGTVESGGYTFDASTRGEWSRVD